MQDVLIVVYLIVAVLLVALVLIQRGKGADMGASFGAGGSNTVFGATGSGNFLTRSTAILATLFFVISLVLGSMTARQSNEVDSLDASLKEAAASAQEQIPADEPTPSDSIPE